MLQAMAYASTYFITKQKKRKRLRKKPKINTKKMHIFYCKLYCKLQKLFIIKTIARSLL